MERRLKLFALLWTPPPYGTRVMSYEVEEDDSYFNKRDTVG